MKTLKNVSTMYRDFEEGSMIILNDRVSIDSLKSLVADLAEDVEKTLKGATPGTSSKLVSDSKKYGHGLAEESDDGYSRQMVEPKHQGTKADPNAVGTEEGAWDRQRQTRKEREERGETPEKGWKKASISSEEAAGIIETVLAIKSVLKAMGKDVEVEADKQEELKELQKQLNEESDAESVKKGAKDKWVNGRNVTKWGPAAPSSKELIDYDNKMEKEKNAIHSKAESEGRSMTKEETDKYQKAHMD